MKTINPLTIKFYTLGCKVNQYETQFIRERFLERGFKEISNGRKADFYLVNTCTVTLRADSDSLKIIRKAKIENPRSRIIVTGCLTELDSAKIKVQVPAAMIVKNKDKENFLKFLPSGSTGKGISYFKNHTRAFLKIHDGCDNFCSYCKVPLVRGRSKSRPLNDIIEEAGRLVKNGFQEIVLTGICLGAYGRGLKEKTSLVDLILALEEIEGLQRIRLSSIEAKDVSGALIKIMAGSEKLCPHLHIPLQSGDDAILKKMNRSYTRIDYLNLIKKIKKKIPRVAITTDCLVGFPGESEENFRNTLSLVKKVMPLKVHIFPYSARPGTVAGDKFKQLLSPEVVKERISRLKNIAEECARKYKSKFRKKQMQVLIESRVKQEPGLWLGHTPNYIPVTIKSRLNLKNKIVLAPVFLGRG